MGGRRRHENRKLNASSALSVQSETNLDIDLDCHRVSVLRRGLELPPPNCFNSFFIEAHAERPLHADIAWPAIRANDHPEQHRSLELCMASLFGIFRVRIVNRAWRGDPAAHAIYASTGSTAMSSTQPRSFSRADAPTTAVSDSTAKPGSVRRWLENRGKWIASLRRRRDGQPRRPYNRRLCGKLGLFIAHDDGWRCHLFPHETR